MRIDGDTRFIALLGHPTSQVRSPGPINAALEKRGINAVILAMDVPPGAVPSLVAGLRRTENCVGLSVTVPHKQAVAALCDTLLPRAAAIGASNIVRREPDGRLIGDMTDGFAMLDALSRAGFAAAGKRCALVGAGGAGSAIGFSLAQAGVRGLTIIDVNEERKATLAETIRHRFPNVELDLVARDLETLNLVVNATPMGMHPDDPLPFDPARLPQGAYVADVVTKPVDTPFLQAARGRGLKGVDGVAMVDSQIAIQLDYLGLVPAHAEALP
jgi:shikimate dehydrogenase